MHGNGSLLYAIYQLTRVDNYWVTCSFELGEGGRVEVDRMFDTSSEPYL